MTNTLEAHTTDRYDEFTALGPDDGEVVWFLATRMTVKATAASTGGQFGLVHVEVPPGFSPPEHIHHRENESFYVLEGEVTFRCGERTISAVAGSFVFLPRDVPHSFVIEGDTPARMLNITTPGGGEGFFVDAGRPADGPGFPPAGPPNIDALRAATATYGSELVGPPMQPRS